MRPTRAILMASLFLALPLAGCFGEEPLPNEYRLNATGGTVAAGWGYDGSGVLGAGASLTGDFANAENTGLAIAEFQIDGERWTITVDQFAQASGKEFMDGGIAYDLVEHGDSGVADTSIPKIFAKIAAWGSAKVTRDGEPVLSPSGKDAWAAHLMASDTTVRGADGKITKADGTTPYDTATAGDARRVEGDRQAFLWVKSPDGETAARPPAPLAATVDCTGPQCAQTVGLDVQKGANVVANISIDQGANPVGVGQFSYTIRSVDGTALDAQSGNLQPGTPFTTTFETMNAAGPLTIEVTGAGAFHFALAGQATYEDYPFLVITWNDFTLE